MPTVMEDAWASFEREPDPGCGNFNERQGVCKKLYPSSFKRGLFKGNAKSRKINPVEMMNALLESDGLQWKSWKNFRSLSIRNDAELKKADNHKHSR